MILFNRLATPTLTVRAMLVGGLALLALGFAQR